MEVAQGIGVGLILWVFAWFFRSFAVLIRSF